MPETTSIPANTSGKSFHINPAVLVPVVGRTLGKRGGRKSGDISDKPLTMSKLAVGVCISINRRIGVYGPPNPGGMKNLRIFRYRWDILICMNAQSGKAKWEPRTGHKHDLTIEARQT